MLDGSCLHCWCGAALACSPRDGCLASRRAGLAALLPRTHLHAAGRSRRARRHRAGGHPGARSGGPTGQGIVKVLAAMSGGVDSSVAAARAVDAGHEVVGVHLALSAQPGTLRTGARGCCTKEDAADARRVADNIDIPFYVWDFAQRFTEDVVRDFVAEYAAGRTPNPCLRCNEKIKFAALLDKALALGFDAVCTGHYAQLHQGVLRRAVDADKDQSYVLAVLTARQLAHAMFPIGDTPKPAVRAEAAARGLRVADKPDSHDICFIPSGDTRAFLGSRLGVRPGAVVDAAADGRPRYVLGIEPATGTVRVGPAAALDVRTIEGTRPVWSAGAAPGARFDCVAQVRAHGGVATAVAEPT